MTSQSTETSDVRQLLERASEQHVAGDLAAAEQCYRSVLARHPDEAAALAGMGVLAGRLGRAGHAVEYLARACTLEPANALFQHNYGEALRQMGQLPLAETSLRRALELDPELVSAWESLISIVRAAHAQALASRDHSRVETLARELARLANNQGNAWLARGGAFEAIECYRRALSIRGDDATVWSNLGNALREVGQVSEAETACRRAIALDPEFGAAWNNLGNALNNHGRQDEASSCFEQALARRPDFPEALHNRGSGSLFNQLYLPSLGYAEIAALHRDWGAAYPAPLDRRWQNSRSPDRILRIGYLSPDYRTHAMRHFIEPLLARHSASRVEIVCYAQSPRADSQTQRLMSYGHRWSWVDRMNDAELAAQIERDAIDILVDCAGHTHGTRITALAGKPAPILMSWLGYLCTTGLPAMDYRLTDEWMDPPGVESPDTETLLRIPGGLMAYRPHAGSPDPGEPPCLASGHITFGSLNNVQKLNRMVVALWARLLRTLPQAKFLMQSKLLVDPGMVWRIRGMFEAFGIPPARLDLRPPSPDFLRTYHEIDIALDTLPCGGGTTTCDALWMGVPVVTLAGTRPAGRLSTSILHRVGRPEWVTHTPTAYIDAAIGLARQTSALTQIRRDLREHVQASALCDEAGFVERLEEVYRAAWKRWLNHS